jgi:hypothetical protein
MDNHIEIIRGRPYRYDADFDAYYPLQQETPASKWAWIVICLVLAAVC